MEEVVGAVLRNFEARFHQFVCKAYILPLMFALALAPAAAEGSFPDTPSPFSALTGSALWLKAQERSAETSLTDLLNPRSAVCRAALRLPLPAAAPALDWEGGGGHVQAGFGWSAADPVEEEVGCCLCCLCGGL